MLRPRDPGGVTVVGAGLVGSLLAVLLAERGYRVGLFDQHPDPRSRSAASGRSINITLARRGLAVLERIGLAEEIRRLSIPAYGRVMHGADGVVSWQPYGNRSEAILSISRHDLHCALIARALADPRVEASFSHKCIDIDLAAPAAELRRPDGETVTVRPERLLASDGAFSAVRRHLQRRPRFDYSQHFVAQGYKELTAPASHCGGLRREAIHIWPRGGFMLIGFANLDGSFTLALHLPFEGEPSFESIRRAEDLRSLFARHFSDAEELVPDLVADYFERPVSHMVTVRCFPWSHGERVVLFGDAAHAIVPSYGQGANSSFEDCAFFFDRLDAAGGDWSRAITDYEAERKPNAEAIADLSLAHFDELQDHVGDPGFLLRKQVERALEQAVPERFMPLYNRVSFTTTSYVEALSAEREQRRLVDRLLSTAGIAEAFSEGRGESLVAETVRRDPIRLNA